MIMLQRNLYSFWVGTNNLVMNENRINGIESLKNNSKVNYILITNENNEIISDNYKITKCQKIGIIPPIGGG